MINVLLCAPLRLFFVFWDTKILSTSTRALKKIGRRKSEKKSITPLPGRFPHAHVTKITGMPVGGMSLFLQFESGRQKFVWRFWGVIT